MAKNHEVEVEVKEREVSLNTIEYASSTAVSSNIEYATPRELEPKYSVFKQPGAWWKQNYLSWRFYVTIYAAMALTVCFSILIGLVAAIGAHGVDQGRVKLYEGSCQKARVSGIFAHGYISVLGTGFLSASCYVMVSGVAHSLRTI